MSRGVRLRRCAATARQPSHGLRSSRACQAEGWWTARGSNSRPPRCERGALPTELAAHSRETQTTNCTTNPCCYTRVEMSALKRLGVLTGGGDAPGLNAVIRAVVKSACNCGIEVVGLEDSFDGLIEPDRSRVLTP